LDGSAKKRLRGEGGYGKHRREGRTILALFEREGFKKERAAFSRSKR